MDVSCFIAERTGVLRHDLRRYHSNHGYKAVPLPCPTVPGEHSYHNAEVSLGDHTADDPAFPAIDPQWEGDSTFTLDHADPRWPRICACGYVFTEDDEWQYNRQRLYRNPHDGTVFLLRQRPDGAIWYAPWMVDHRDAATPEELATWNSTKHILSVHYMRDWFGKRPPLMVQLPRDAAGVGYTWCVDQTANNGDGWVVTGEPPLITCSPSILVPNYHGWLRNGVLVTA